jgi:protein gp37
MGANSHIEWCDHTFNPVIGCAKVSPGCLNCYAERQDNHRKWTPEGWGKGKPRKRTSPSNWQQVLRWNRKGQDAPRRPRVFVASLSDWLDPEWAIADLADLLDLIRQCPHLDFLMLSKRPELFSDRMGMALSFIRETWTHHEGRNLSEMIAFLENWLYGLAPDNIWIGTTVEDQQRADLRIPQLRRIPARVRFLSCEPMLGRVDLIRHCNHEAGPHARFRPVGCVDWVICGGESGPGARPMDPAWARHLKEQCEQASIPFFMKQMGGARKPFPEIPEDLNVRETPEGAGLVIH